MHNITLTDDIQSVGPFSLGDSLRDVIRYAQGHSGRYRIVHFAYDKVEPFKSDILLKLNELTLRFHRHTQRLLAIVADTKKLPSHYDKNSSTYTVDILESKACIRTTNTDSKSTTATLNDDYNTIRFHDNKQISLDMTMQQVLDILGPYDRYVEKNMLYQTSHVKLGLSLLFSSLTHRIVSMSLYTNLPGCYNEFNTHEACVFSFPNNMSNKIVLSNEQMKQEIYKYIFPDNVKVNSDIAVVEIPDSSCIVELHLINDYLTRIDIKRM